MQLYVTGRMECEPVAEAYFYPATGRKCSLLVEGEFCFAPTACRKNETALKGEQGLAHGMAHGMARGKDDDLFGT